MKEGASINNTHYKLILTQNDHRPNINAKIMNSLKENIGVNLPDLGLHMVS